jgi:hypothetical protein
MNAEQEGRELAEHLVSVDDGVIRQLREEVSEVYREEIAQLRQQIVERDQRIEQLARWVREERVAKGLSEEKLDRCEVHNAGLEKRLKEALSELDMLRPVEDKKPPRRSTRIRERTQRH